MMMFGRGTRNPSTGKGPRIGNTPPPPVRKNKEELNMLNSQGTRHPDNSNAPRIGDKELPSVKRNMTDKERLEMLFKYIDALKSVYGSGIDRRALRQSIVKTFAEIEKLLMSDELRLNWKIAWKEQERSE